MEANRRLETVRDLAHVWVGREATDDGGYQYVKRWKKQGMPWAEYWPLREHSLLVRLAEGDIRHVVEVIGIDATVNEVRTRDAGISLDRLDRRVLVKGQPVPHPHPFFEITELLKLMRWALLALEEIHGLGLVHCDLSAGNVCLPLVPAGESWWYLDYSRLRLIDFAFALHRNLPLKYPLPVDTTAPEVFFLPPYFRAAIARDQQENRAAHGQRVMSPGIDLYSLGMITQAWYWAGFRPHARVPAAAVEALFRRLASHGRGGAWPNWWHTDDRPLRHTIDRLLERAGADVTRSADLRFLAAEARPLLARTAITPLVTRIRAPAPRGDRAEAGPTAAAAALAAPDERRVAAAAARAPAPAARGHAPLPAPSPSGTGSARRDARRRPYSALLLAVLGATLFLTDLRVDLPPPAPAETRTVDFGAWESALAGPDVSSRSASAQELARLARAGEQGMALAEQVAARFVELLRTSAASADAPTRHAAAWTALSALADHAGELPLAAVARQALGEYEQRTEDLHRRLGGLVYDGAAQASAPDWNDYVLHLSTLAHAGSPRGALMLGMIERSGGRHAEAFRHLRAALLQGADQKAASDEIGRLLQGLVDSDDRQALTAIVPEVEEMAGQQYPGWQIWAARINDVLGERGKAAAWYRRVSENQAAGVAERDYARSELARRASRP